MRASFAILAFLGACSFRPLVLPAQGGASYAMAKEDGVGLVADATAWNGHPDDLEDFATPVAIELRNDSGRDIRFKLADLTLTDEHGRVYRAWQVGTADPQQQPPQQPVAPPASQPSREPSLEEEEDELQAPPAASKVQAIDSEEEAAPVSAVYHPDQDGGLILARGGGHFGGRHFGGGSRGHFGGYGGHHGGHIGRGPSIRGPSIRPPSVYFYGPSHRYYGRPYYGGGYYGGYYGWPYYYSPYSYGWGWGSPYYGYNYGYSYGYGAPPAQRDDVVRLAVRDTVVANGALVRGFVYFEHATDESSSLTLHVPVRDAKTDQELTELKTVFYVQR